MNSLDMGIRYISYKPRTEKEVRVYLNDKGVSLDEINDVVSKLKAAKFINDLQYVKDYTRYALEKKRGKFRIEMELRDRGVSSFDIEDGMYAFEEEEDISLDSIMLMNARKVRDSILGSLEADKRQRDKVMRKLNYLGYNQSVIIKVLQEIS